MDAKQFLKEKGISNNDFMDSGVADLIETLLTEHQALQLQQTGVSSSFSPEQLQEYTSEIIFKHLVVNYGLKLTYQEWLDKNYC